MTTEYAGHGRLEALVPRTTAQTSRGAAEAAALRRGRPVAWWGMLMLVASESTLFGCLFGTYLYLWFKSAHWPPLGAPEPPVLVPVVLALVLAASAVPLRFATRAARSARVGRVWALIALALLVQAGYLAYSIHDFQHRLDSLTPQDNAYGSITYVLLGADHAHVAAGIVLSLWLLLKLSRGLTTYRLNALSAIAFYWYAVIVLTAFVTLTLISPRL
jgi:heme/copper-type cytochrome/quinol oxidase subunit 3